MDSLKPYQFQLEDIERIVACEGNGIVATQVGGGKTLVAVEVAKRLKARTVLVIAPKGTHKRGWEATVLRQVPDAEVKYCNSSYQGRKALNDLTSGKPGWYLISPEFFRKFAWNGIKPDFAVFDEAHRASNRKSKTAIMLHTLKAKSRLAMSGTIAGNSIDGLWSIIRWVFPDVAGRSYWNWVDEYCETSNDFFAGKVINGEKVPGSIVASVPCYIRHLKREACCEHHPEGVDHQIPPVVDVVRTIDLSMEQKKIYSRIENDLIAWLGEHPLVVDVPVAMRVRLRQITLGVPSIEDDGTIVFADDCRSSKIDELFNIVDDSPKGEKMLILTHSQKFASVVVKRLKSKGFNAFEWSGKASQNDRDKAVISFVEGGLQFIVAVISAIGEGVDGLQHACSTVVWLSRDDNNLLNEQAAGRLNRQGQVNTIVSYDIVATNTYDEGQLSSLVLSRLAMNNSLRKDAIVD